MSEEERYERYITVEQSIIGSVKEMKLMQAGKLPKKTWAEFLEELRAEDELEKQNEQSNKKYRINKTF